MTSLRTPRTGQESMDMDMDIIQEIQAADEEESIDSDIEMEDPDLNETLFSNPQAHTEAKDATVDCETCNLFETRLTSLRNESPFDKPSYVQTRQRLEAHLRDHGFLISLGEHLVRFGIAGPADGNSQSKQSNEVVAEGGGEAVRGSEAEAFDDFFGYNEYASGGGEKVHGSEEDERVFDDIFDYDKYAQDCDTHAQTHAH